MRLSNPEKAALTGGKSAWITLRGATVDQCLDEFSPDHHAHSTRERHAEASTLEL